MYRLIGRYQRLNHLELNDIVYTQLKACSQQLN